MSTSNTLRLTFLKKTSMSNPAKHSWFFKNQTYQSSSNSFIYNCQIILCRSRISLAQNNTGRCYNRWLSEIPGILPLLCTTILPLTATKKQKAFEIVFILHNFLPCSFLDNNLQFICQTLFRLWQYDIWQSS